MAVLINSQFPWLCIMNILSIAIITELSIPSQFDNRTQMLSTLISYQMILFAKCVNKQFTPSGQSYGLPFLASYRCISGQNSGTIWEQICLHSMQGAQRVVW
jgi:hypothetical protein